MLHVFNALVGECAITGPAGGIKVDIPTAVGRDVSMAKVDQAVDQLLHLWDVSSGSRFIAGPQQP